MTSQDIRIPICCWANCDSQYTESPGMDVCDDPANLQHTPKIRMVLVFVRMLWALLCHLIKKKKKDTKCKIHIQLTRLLRCLSVQCPGPSFTIPPVQRTLSLIERDLECTVHPRGSGLLVTVGWS